MTTCSNCGADFSHADTADPDVIARRVEDGKLLGYECANCHAEIDSMVALRLLDGPYCVCRHPRAVHAIPPVPGRSACHPDERYVSDGAGGTEEVWHPCDCEGFREGEWRKWRAAPKDGEPTAAQVDERFRANAHFLQGPPR